MESTPILTRSYTLPRGPRVRLRLVRGRDAPAIRELLSRRGCGAEELELARLLRFDPRQRAVICATALVGSTETIVGIGAIELDAFEPDVMLVDETLTEGLDELLRRALVGRAREIARRRAA